MRVIANLSVTSPEPGDIVMVDTRDAQFGHVRVPGIVRYAHTGVEESGAPEGFWAIALMVPGPSSQQFLVDPLRGVHQWDLAPHEFQVVGSTHVEYPREAVGGQVMFTPDSEPKVIEQVRSHRQIVG
jgi:hypothetical protein